MDKQYEYPAFRDLDLVKKSSNVDFRPEKETAAAEVISIEKNGTVALQESQFKTMPQILGAALPCFATMQQESTAEWKVDQAELFDAPIQHLVTQEDDPCQELEKKADLKRFVADKVVRRLTR